MGKFAKRAAAVLVLFVLYALMRIFVFPGPGGDGELLREIGEANRSLPFAAPDGSFVLNRVAGDENANAVLTVTVAARPGEDPRAAFRRMNLARALCGTGLVRALLARGKTVAAELSAAGTARTVRTPLCRGEDGAGESGGPAAGG